MQTRFLSDRRAARLLFSFRVGVAATLLIGCSAPARTAWGNDGAPTHLLSTVRPAGLWDDPQDDLQDEPQGEPQDGLGAELETDAVLDQDAPTPPEEFRVKSGFYLGLTYAFASIDGDFDGESALVGPDDLIVIPEFDDGSGFGIALGGGSSKGTFEFYYESTQHDGDFLGLGVDGTLTSCGFRGRIVPGKKLGDPSRRVRPFLLLGLGLHGLDIEDGSVDAGGNIGDGELFGIGAEIGVGVFYNPHPRITTHAGYTWRLIEFTSAEGAAGESASLGDNLSGSGQAITFGVNFTL